MGTSFSNKTTFIAGLVIVVLIQIMWSQVNYCPRRDSMGSLKTTYLISSSVLSSKTLPINLLRNGVFYCLNHIPLSRLSPEVGHSQIRLEWDHVPHNGIFEMTTTTVVLRFGLSGVFKEDQST